MTPQKVVRQSLKDQVKSILIDRIVEGHLEAGDRLKELQIAKELGTSQAPVREAIRCLETLGYVEHIPHVGAMVKRFNKKEVEEAYQVREALEVHAVSLIDPEIEQLTEELDDCLKDMRKATQSGNVRLFITADNQFHRAIVSRSGNETMMNIWDSLKMQLHVIATLVEASMPLEKVYDLHPPIVIALKLKNFSETARLLEGHYDGVGAYWKNVQ